MPVHGKPKLDDLAGGYLNDEFVKLLQICKDGLSIFSRDLCYVQVNERMAKINGKSIKEHIGRTVQQVDPSVALVLEPVLLQVFESGRPLVDLEMTVSRSAAANALEYSYWIISCYPFMNKDGMVKTVGVIVCDISEQKLKDAVQEDRLKFEALLSDLSAAFINVHVSEVDKKIESGMQKIVEFLGFDRSTIWHVSQTDGQLHITYSFALPGIPHPPPVIQDDVPVWTAIWKRGEIYGISDIDELPEDQWREKKYCKELGGIRSVLFIPLRVGGVLEGIISFVSYRVKRVWPDLLIQRLRLLSEMIENALERKRADQKMQIAMEEIEQLKDRLAAENLYLRDQIEVAQKHEKIIGQSEVIKIVLRLVEQVAKTDSSVLILGETGTGKELIAGAIHKLSERKDRTMIKLNCAALPATLIESELFGREKGAFTGALATQIGRFEAANGSSIFLDEIGELPLELQAKLLRVIQEGQFERLGSTVPITIDVRIIAATNRNLMQAVLDGKFREDLYYRLNVFPIFLPSLRERSEDIPLLVWAMVKEFEKTFGKTIERISKKNMEELEKYKWPGNIRELRNVIERAMILCNNSSLIIDLPGVPGAISTDTRLLEDVERKHIISVMESTGWRVRGKNGAAEIMNLKPTTLDAKMKRLGIKRKYLPAKLY
jgi:transcriptional regulator with GAF, ATPase, and Fis domain